MLAAAFMAAVASYYTNEHRISKHITRNYSGTFRLIGEGVARHEGENRAQWLNAIEKLSGLAFVQQSAADSGLSDHRVGELKEKGFQLTMDASLTEGLAFIHIPGSEDLLSVKLDDFGSALVRVSTFLVLNELGRHKSSDRVEALNSMRDLFAYPIKLRELSKLQLSATNLNMVKNGSIAVEFNNSTTSSPSLTAFARLGNSPYVLAFGPIDLFEWFPLGLIIALIIMVLVFMATATYLFVHPIEKRLNVIDLQIDQIGKDQDISISSPKGLDAISRLDGTVSEMASRIHRLIGAQNDMVRAISHELRTPITRIRFRLSNVEDTQVPGLQEETDGIERDLVELEKLIDEVLTFTKLKREKPLISMEPIGLDHFFKEIEKSVTPLADKVEVTFEPQSHTQFHGDRRFLHRAIENLILNAVKYANSKVEVRYVTTEQYQHIYVSDDGPGVPPAHRTSIFEPFTRLDASRCRTSGGYGLGLAIVRQIAMWHQGSAQVKESRWGGADMVFSWPLQLNQEQA